MEIVRRESWRADGYFPRLVPNGGDRRDRDTFHVSFDPPTEDVVEVVVSAVATIKNVEHHELEPLQGSVDPDALERLIDRTGKERTGDFEVTFTYHGFEITVGEDGDVWLTWR